jgi:hypothetical protein
VKWLAGGYLPLRCRISIPMGYRTVVPVRPVRPAEKSRGSVRSALETRRPVLLAAVVMIVFRQPLLRGDGWSVRIVHFMSLDKVCRGN